MKNKEEIVKSVVKVGNSAGVILPREMLNSLVKIEVIRRPLNIYKDIFEILQEYMEDIQGIYVTGSYARGEQTKTSDVDVLVITNATKKKIVQGKYSIILVPKLNIEEILKKNAFPLLPMLKEAKILMNKEAVLSLNMRLTRTNLKWYFETSESALEVNASAIGLAKENNEKCDDAIAYSLVLNLRSAYILHCLIKDSLWSNRELKKIITVVSGSLTAYKGYLRVKEDKRKKEELSVEEADRLYDYIKTELEKHRKWLKTREE